MERFRVKIKNTDTQEAQRILQDLNSERDVLLTVGEVSDYKECGIRVDYVKPINDLREVGTIADEDIETLIEEFGENISIDIDKYEVTYKDGVYGLEAELGVTVYEEEKEKCFKMPVALCVTAAVFTGLATIVYFLAKLCKKNKK